jgi:hypothetical protein
MKPATSQLLQSLETVEWFANVGSPTTGANAAPVRTWDEAVAHCTSHAWHAFRLDAMNDVHSKVWHASRARLDEWNDVNAEMQRRVSELLSRKVDPLIAGWDLPRPAELRVSVLWDVSMAAMECEYADLLTPGGVFALLVEVYKLGHFPCGVDAENERFFVL